MFRNRNQRVKQAPRNGQQVLLRARVSLYEGRGEYQLIVEHLEDAGAGALQRAFEELKARLRAEGLFADERKLALPEYPERIAIISSASGAAVRDILTVFRRRFPVIDLFLLPVPVQGVEAPPAIIHALKLANRAADFDAILVSRGGGSAEDLAAFNDEGVARAIADSRIPVVSAVGHEIDFTIADFVADHRAPTPSAAAEVLSPDQQEVMAGLKACDYALSRLLKRRLSDSGERLTALRRQLRHPGERLREQAQRLDDYELRLRRGIDIALRQQRQHLALQASRLQSHSPRRDLEKFELQLGQLARRASSGIQALVNQRRQSFALASGKLDSLSPLATLRRGYAIVSDESGSLVTGVTQVEEGAVLDTRLADGHLRSRVIERKQSRD
jgi:exodeoxyribonuclease VII large subunit